jgi:hypothetical protein
MKKNRFASLNFNADLDPTFHFYADPDPSPHRSNAGLLQFGPLRLHCEHSGPLRLHFEPLKLVNLLFHSQLGTSFFLFFLEADRRSA